MPWHRREQRHSPVLPRRTSPRSAHPLITLASHLAHSINADETDHVEVSLRSAGPAGALVYGERAHPRDVIAAVRALGRAPLSTVLATIARRVPARRRAFKIDTQDALSLFHAIDYSYDDLITLCAPFGLGSESAALADVAEELGVRLSGWAIEGDATGTRFRVRAYVMAGSDQTTIPADLAGRTAQAGARPEMVAAWRKWTRRAPVVVNLGLRAGRPPAVKFEFPDIDLDDLDGPPRWVTRVRELADDLGVTTLSHLGIRWQDSRPEHCAYLAVPRRLIQPTRSAP